MNIDLIKLYVSRICMVKLCFSFIIFFIYETKNSNDSAMLFCELIITNICMMHFKENYTLEILFTAIGFTSCFACFYLFIEMPTKFGIMSFSSVLSMYVWFVVYMNLYLYSISDVEEEDLKKD